MLLRPAGAYGAEPSGNTLGRVTGPFSATARRLAFHALIVAGLVFSAYVVFVAAPAKGTFAIDTLCYWGVNLADPYVTPWGNCAVPVPPFGYGPPFALLLAPLTAL